jgi:hypothetical protein
MADKIGLLTQEQYANQMRMRVQNSGIGSTPGIEQVITTTTQIVAGVVNTLYYELQEKIKVQPKLHFNYNL